MIPTGHKKAVAHLEQQPFVLFIFNSPGSFNKDNHIR